MHSDSATGFKTIFFLQNFWFDPNWDMVEYVIVWAIGSRFWKEQSSVDDMLQRAICRLCCQADKEMVTRGFLKNQRE